MTIAVFVTGITVFVLTAPMFPMVTLRLMSVVSVMLTLPPIVSRTALAFLVV